METLNAIAFCGCPGVASDLETLQNAVDASSLSCAVHGCESLAEGDAFLGTTPLLVIGYSRGCMKALQFAAMHPVRGVLLLSPHWGTPVSPWFRALVRMPLVSSLLLSLLGRRAVRQMIWKTCGSLVVPPAYAALEKVYAQPRVLRRCFLEPSFTREALEKVRSGVSAPVRVLVGEEDAPAQEASSMLSKVISSRVPRAAHALPWTHPEICALAIKNFLEENGI